MRPKTQRLILFSVTFLAIYLVTLLTFYDTTATLFNLNLADLYSSIWSLFFIIFGILIIIRPKLDLLLIFLIVNPLLLLISTIALLETDELISTRALSIIFLIVLYALIASSMLQTRKHRKRRLKHRRVVNKNIKHNFSDLYNKRNQKDMNKAFQDLRKTFKK